MHYSAMWFLTELQSALFFQHARARAICSQSGPTSSTWFRCCFSAHLKSMELWFSITSQRGGGVVEEAENYPPHTSSCMTPRFGRNMHYSAMWFLTELQSALFFQHARARAICSQSGPTSSTWFRCCFSAHLKSMELWFSITSQPPIPCAPSWLTAIKH